VPLRIFRQLRLTANTKRAAPMSLAPQGLLQASSEFKCRRGTNSSDTSSIQCRPSVRSLTFYNGMSCKECKDASCKVHLRIERSANCRLRGCFVQVTTCAHGTLYVHAYARRSENLWETLREKRLYKFNQKLSAAALCEKCSAALIISRGRYKNVSEGGMELGIRGKRTSTLIIGRGCRLFGIERL
jgi:hypothetical protein